MSPKHTGFYAKRRETCQRIRRPKAAPIGHYIKFCILDKLGGYEKPSVGVDSHGHVATDNEGLVMKTSNKLVRISKVLSIFRKATSRLIVIPCPNKETI